MFPLYGRNDERTDRERYLEDELERVQAQQREEEDRRFEQRERKRREREEEREYEYRQASTWPEALAKQRVLYSREIELDGEVTGYFFTNSAQACEKALEIWRAVEAKRQGEIEELQRQIESVHEQIRLQVADLLEAADERTEYRGLASQIRDDQLVGFLDW